MKIVIIGDGKVGHKLAKQLSEEDHDIVLIDHKSAKLKNSMNELDVIGIEGDGASHEVLIEAGIDTANLAIACTSSDSMNMMCCLLAKKLGAEKTIARVRNPVYYKQMYLIKDDLRLSMAVNPELEVAEEISRVLIFPSASKIETFAKGKVELVEFKVEQGTPIDGLSLEELSKKYSHSVLICAVKRNQKVLIPSGDFVLESGDKIYIASSHRGIEKFFKVTGKFKNRVSTVMICGGSRVSYYLARKLCSLGVQVKILERDYDRCMELCELLPDVTIIHGDATNHELLEEEGIDRVGAFVALTGIDEENIIMSIYAKTRKASKIVTKVNSEPLTSIVDDIGIETVVSPKTVTADTILGYVRAMQNSLASANIETVYRLVNNQIEAIEFIIRENTSYLGIPIKELKLKDNLLIACIVRKRKIIIPNGDELLKIGDSVIVVTTCHRFNDLNDIFKVEG
ncbi:Trk system potassium transporter TrkA [Metaclostridioides mangenotii]|uniref:Trk system potassium transporter TrkA n=1 Tax=Metaclostridioides mangenotii TaxID=1540 RepID=UPI000481D1DE|nr:Trk system potassium transporter TrkA [Clostridioides mangenotii]